MAASLIVVGIIIHKIGVNQVFTKKKVFKFISGSFFNLFSCFCKIHAHILFNCHPYNHVYCIHLWGAFKFLIVTFEFYVHQGNRFR